MGAAPRDRQGIASAVMATARNLGMALGVGLAGAIFTSVLASAAGSTGASATAHPAIFDATRASFLVAAALALVGVGISATRAACRYLLNNPGGSRAGLRPCPSWLGQETGHSR